MEKTSFDIDAFQCDVLNALDDIQGKRIPSFSSESQAGASLFAEAMKAKEVTGAAAVAGAGAAVTGATAAGAHVMAAGVFVALPLAAMVSIFKLWGGGDKDKEHEIEQVEKVAEDVAQKKNKEHEIEQVEKAAIKVEKVAEEVVQKKDVRKILCPALQSVSNDAYEIAKVITPILVPLILTGTISIQLNPLLFATMALVIARMGIASTCAEHKGLLEAKSHP